MCETFYDGEDVTPARISRIRRALAVSNQIVVETLEGSQVDIEEAGATIHEILFGGDEERDVEDDKEEHRAIIYDIKNTGNQMEYFVQESDGEDKPYTRYELKKKYPDTWKQMVQAYKKLNTKTRQIIESDSPTSSDLGEQLGNGVVKNVMCEREEEAHQGSTKMGSSDEKRLISRKSKKVKGLESHGEGGVDTYEKDNSPKPAVIYGDHAVGYRKRLSEPPLVGRNRPIMYSPHLQGSNQTAKRFRAGVNDGLQGDTDVPFTFPTQTDTAATAWTLLSKIMHNENTLIAALEEQKLRNNHLEKLVLEAGEEIVQPSDPEREAELEKVLEKKTKELDSLKSSLRTSMDAKQSILMEVATLEKQLEDAHAKVKSLEDEYSKMTSYVSKCEENFKKTEQMRLSKIDAGQKEIEALKLEVAGSKKEQALLIKGLAIVEENLKKTSQERDDLEERIATNEKRFKEEMRQATESQQKGLRDLSESLLKAHVSKDTALEKAREKETALKMKMEQLHNKHKEEMGALSKENETLRTRISAFSRQDVDAMSVINMALRMQRESRRAIDILKRGDSLEIASFYENVEFDAAEGSKETDTVKKWLHPRYWKDCSIVGAKNKDGITQYKCINTKTKETAYIGSTDMQKRQFCLLPMLQFIEKIARPSE